MSEEPQNTTDKEKPGYFEPNTLEGKKLLERAKEVLGIFVNPDKTISYESVLLLHADKTKTLEEIARTPELYRLTTLDVNQSFSINSQRLNLHKGLIAVLESPHFTITELRIRADISTGIDLEDFIPVPEDRKENLLRSLQRSKRYNRIRRVFACRKAQWLRSLTISSEYFGIDGLEAIADSDNLHSLQEITIRSSNSSQDSRIDDKSIKIILNSKKLRGLSTLNLFNSRVEKYAIIALAESEETKRLKRLGIGRDIMIYPDKSIKEKPLYKLITSPNLENLEVLDFASYVMGDSDYWSAIPIREALKNAHNLKSIKEILLLESDVPEKIREGWMAAFPENVRKAIKFVK